MNATAGGWVKPDPLSNPNSFERRFRTRRFARLQPLIEAALREKDRIEIIDLGGTERYWEIGSHFLSAHRERITITLVNNETPPAPSDPMFRSVEGDACAGDLFAGRRFDLVHSNSVIEHVGERPRMAAFARTVHRLSDRHFIQTPNYWFPLEPHFRVVGFQYLPVPVRAALMRRFNLGFFPRARTPEEALDNVREIRLLDQRMMRAFFPESQIETERVAGLVKSIMAIRG